jgi:transcriptional/translational regulatory protein YebC/TACO1
MPYNAADTRLLINLPEYGPDPKINPRLATVITTAKKMGFPKASIESAIARGQGVSPNRAPLENVTIEAMIPPSVAVHH